MHARHLTRTKRPSFVTFIFRNSHPSHQKRRRHHRKMPLVSSARRRLLFTISSSRHPCHFCHRKFYTKSQTLFRTRRRHRWRTLPLPTMPPVAIRRCHQQRHRRRRSSQPRPLSPLQPVPFLLRNHFKP